MLYIDDILIAYKDKQSVCELKILLNSKFEMKDLRDAKRILGMKITWDKINGTLIVLHEKYHLKILGNFGMDKENPVGTPLGIHFKSRATTEREKKRTW